MNGVVIALAKTTASTAHTSSQSCPHVSSNLTRPAVLMHQSFDASVGIQKAICR